MINVALILLFHGNSGTPTRLSVMLYVYDMWIGDAAVFPYRLPFYPRSILITPVVVCNRFHKPDPCARYRKPFTFYLAINSVRLRKLIPFVALRTVLVYNTFIYLFIYLLCNVPFEGFLLQARQALGDPGG